MNARTHTNTSAELSDNNNWNESFKTRWGRPDVLLEKRVGSFHSAGGRDDIEDMHFISLG